MAKPELIARQSRRPSGWFGEIVARVMSFETQRRTGSRVAELAPGAGEAVLEVGCGHGRTLARLAEAPCAFLAGIDPSEVMVRLARRSDCAAGSKRAARRSGWPRARRSRYPDERFDAALAMHVVYFWNEPLGDLRELRRVLRPGGRVLLGYRPRDARSLAALPRFVYALRSVAEIEELLAEAGFVAIRSVERAIGSAPLAFSPGPTSRAGALSAARRTRGTGVILTP